MECTDAQKAIYAFFKNNTKEAEKAFDDVVSSHITKSTPRGENKIKCFTCWNYMQKLGQQYIDTEKR